MLFLVIHKNFFVLLVCLKGMCIRIHNLFNLECLARHRLATAPQMAGDRVNIILDVALPKAHMTDYFSSFAITFDC